MRRLLLCGLFLPLILTAQNNTKKEISAKRINQYVIIDGKMDEPFWSNIISAKNFTMIEPISGKIERPHQKTEVKFAAAGDAGISTV